MKGLFLKDIYQLWQNGKIIFLYVLVFGVITITTNNPGFLAAMGAVVIFTIPMNNMALDERGGWDKMAAATPVGRNAVIAVRYIITLALGLLIIVAQFAVIGINALVQPGSNILETLLSSLVSLAVMGVMMMILLPIMVKTGVEKGRMLMMLLFGGGFAVIMLLSVLSESLGFRFTELALAPWMLAVIVAVVLVVTVAVSYKLSCHFYAKKEF